MDPDGDLLSVRFTQQSGALVMLSDPQSLEPSFTAPQVTEPTMLTFAAVVNDGTVDSAPAIVNVNVTSQTRRPAPPAPPAPRSSTAAPSPR